MHSCTEEHPKIYMKGAPWIKQKVRGAEYGFIHSNYFVIPVKQRKCVYSFSYGKTWTIEVFPLLNISTTKT